MNKRERGVSVGVAGTDDSSYSTYDVLYDKKIKLIIYKFINLNLNFIFYIFNCAVQYPGTVDV